MGKIGIMGESASFANAAGRGGMEMPELSFVGSSDDPYIQSLSCNGKITIESIKNGKPVVKSYYALRSQKVDIQADADTIVLIKGYVTELQFTKYNNDPDIDDWEGYMELSSVSVGDNSNIKILSIALNENIEELDLAANTQLQNLYCNSCTGLTSLDLAANTQLQNLDCYGCTGLTLIKYGAGNENVSTAIAGAITDANAIDGTVYTDSAEAYYSTIADAATAKGWTIEQLA